MLTRHIGVDIFADGESVMETLSAYLKSISYTDNSGGSSDTAEIELRDDEQKFIGDFLPKKGLTVSIILWTESWSGDGINELNLGVFELDEMTLSYPPSIARLKLNSISQNSGLRQNNESHSWEDCKLSRIARDVADKAGVQLVYEATDDPTIRRAEQVETSALSFLEKLCTDSGLALKVTDGKLIVFDETKLEAQAPVARLVRGSSTIKRFSATSTLQEVYRRAEVTYSHGQKSETISGSFDAPDKSEGKVLKINQRVESKAEADRLAKNALRDKNKKETQVRVTTVGDFKLLSGNVVELVNHGKFDGKYLIEKSTHKIDSSGYTVDLELRKCLNGY